MLPFVLSMLLIFFSQNLPFTFHLVLFFRFLRETVSESEKDQHDVTCEATSS